MNDKIFRRQILRVVNLATAVLMVGATVSAQGITEKEFTTAELQALHQLRSSAGSMPVGSRLAATGSSQLGSNGALKVTLKKQADASGYINPQAPANQPIAPTGTEGGQIGGSGSAPMASRNGRPQTPASTNPGIAAAQAPIPHCSSPGIHNVNGQNVGAIFTPITEYNGYVSGYKSNVNLIRGCGFGQAIGKAYIDPTYDPAPGATNSFSPPARLASHQGLELRVVNAQWSDSSILVEVDPNTSGYLATQSATLHVLTADSREYQAHGFQFYPVYEDQKLSHLPLTTRLLKPSANRTSLQAQSNGDHLAQVKDANGNPVVTHYLSPSAGSLIFDPNHTFAVVRIAHASFGFAMDTFDIAGVLKEGFEFKEAHMSEAVLPGDSCKAPYSYETSGAWNHVYATGQLQITWQEQGCQWEKRAGDRPTPSSQKSDIARAPAPVVSPASSNDGGGEGASAYVIDIIVNGPRGVSPLR